MNIVPVLYIPKHHHRAGNRCPQSRYTNRESVVVRRRKQKEKNQGQSERRKREKNESVGEKRKLAE
jgi:hypothetical protein